MATKKLLFLLLATLTCFNEVRGGLLSAISVACSCPKDDSLPKPCQEAITPPWPICLFHSTDYFLAKSIKGYNRCCNPDDLSECRCPRKDTTSFQKHIGEWCEKVSSCIQSEPAFEGDIETE
mmetsp:Transcript_1890/g.2619  ORF Transcript_1890/g.2619 Transcript_1890/m.2619 type:complete len:122 (+) Transcript_1890:123-488(+)